MSTPNHDTELEEILVNLWQGDNFYSKWPESGAIAATDKRIIESEAAINTYLYKQTLELIGPVTDAFTGSRYWQDRLRMELRKAAAERWGQEV